MHGAIIILLQFMCSPSLSPEYDSHQPGRDSGVVDPVGPSQGQGYTEKEYVSMVAREL